MSAMSAMAAVAPAVQARFGAKPGKAVKARRSVVVAAVTEPATNEKPKRKFAKKNITVKPEEVVVGASFTGKVKRVQEYGCFVDFGAKNDGLVHISELTNGFVENVSDVVKEEQDVTVWIKSIDEAKGRISLTMKPPPSAEEMEAIAAKEAAREAKFQERKEQKKAAEAAMSKLKSVKKGQQIEGVVKSIQPFGAFVEIQDGIEGLVHVTEMSDDYNIEVSDFVTVGQTVNVRILGVDGAKVKLSMKEKMGLKEMVQGIQVEASAGVMEVAFKTKGVTPAQFPGFDQLEKAKAEAPAEPEAAAEEPAAAEPAAEEPAAAEPVAEAAAAPAEAAKEEPKKEEEAAKPAAAAGGISAKQVKEIRDKTGAGMMDCKKALTECNGDLEEAIVWLRKKGMASADKKASRIAAEGAIGAYIHAGSRLGVIVEVNCETDFVARGDVFKELVADIAMQVAACPDIEYVSPEDVDPAMVEAERAVQMKMEDMLSKPENIREKIVQGRLDKMVNEKALIKQDFIKDTTKTVEEIIKEATAEIGEKISVRRFTKYNLGEGLEKRNEDFAAEVAAQMGK